MTIPKGPITEDSSQSIPSDARLDRPLTHLAIPVPDLDAERTSFTNVPRAVTASFFGLANLLILTHVHLPFIEPAVAIWLVLAAPIYLLFTTSVWGITSIAERLAYSVGGALLILILGGLLLNTLLPWAGAPRALDTLPVLIMMDAANVGLVLLRRSHPSIPNWRKVMARLTREEGRLICSACASVPLVILGANRLNNGSGNEVTLIALAVIIITLTLLLQGSQRVKSGVTSLALYIVSTSLLLMTSLRGWSVTGHDVQLEYRVFQLTKAHGHWDMSALSSAYNACLSITILPTEFSSLIRIDDPYIYKFVFQLLFAICPVIVYAISRRFFTERISILAAIYFVGFPTFFTDMPFLNRQEIAFLFVGVGILAFTNPHWNRRKRQVALVIAAIGVELSHYSTSYVFLGTLLVAWLVELVGQVGRRRKWHAHSRRHRQRRWATTTRSVGFGCLIAVSAVTVAWGGLVTHTATGAAIEIKGALSEFVTHSGGSHSSADASVLISVQSGTPQHVLDEYRALTLKLRARAPSGTYLPAPVVGAYSTPVVKPVLLPLTAVGHILSNNGLSPVRLNRSIRQIAAIAELLFLIIGMASLVVIRERNRSVSREYFYLCIGGLTMLLLIAAVPALSVEYNILRLFQQDLIFLAPILVIGSISAFRLLGDPWSMRVAMTTSLFLFASTSGLFPQLLGGYSAQLNLNNSGIYYDVYYMHSEEEAAVTWLYGKPGTLPSGIQTDTNSNRFAFTDLSQVTGSQYVTDLYPTGIRKSAWIILDYHTVTSGQAIISINGRFIAYRYPLDLLDRNKNLVFNDGRTKIYR